MESNERFRSDWNPSPLQLKNAVLRIVVHFIQKTSSFGKYLLMSCPAAKATIHIENQSLFSNQSSDLGSLPYRLLHHGVSSIPNSSVSIDSSYDDLNILSIQILESLIRGTNQETWSPAIRSILSQSILTHLRTHFIHFSNSNGERYPPQLVGHLLSLLCSCLLAPPTSTSITESNFDQQPKGSSSSNLPHLFTSSLSLPELVQWIDDRYFSSSPSCSPPLQLLTSFYSFLSRISYFGASDKLYSHHNRKLCSTLFTNDDILRILRRTVQSHLLRNQSLHDAINQFGLVTLWMVLYSSESVRGKWKKLMNEKEENEEEFNWKYFLTTHLLEGDGTEERKEKKKDLSLTDQAILSITSLLSSSSE